MKGGIPEGCVLFSDPLDRRDRLVRAESRHSLVRTLPGTSGGRTFHTVIQISLTLPRDTIFSCFDRFLLCFRGFLLLLLLFSSSSSCFFCFFFLFFFCFVFSVVFVFFSFFFLLLFETDSELVLLFFLLLVLSLFSFSFCSFYAYSSFPS